MNLESHPHLYLHKRRRRHREVPFDRGVVLVLGLHADGIGGCVGFEIESGGGLEGAVGLEGK